MAYVFNYKEMTKDFLDMVSAVGDAYKGEDYTATWLYNYDDSPLEEAERLNVLLPLIKWCVEHDKMSEYLLDELYLYHEDFSEGRLDGILDPTEADAVIRDLEWSFHKAFPDEK